MTTAKILLGSTQTLRSYPQLDIGTGELVRGQAASVTVRIETPAEPMPDEDAGVAGDVDTLSTTLSGDALEGATQLFVVSATWRKHVRYLITKPTGESATIESLTEGASDTLDLKNEIPFDAPTDSTIDGIEVSIDLTADQTELAGQGLALWRAVFGAGAAARTYEWAQPFRIVRRIPVPSLTSSELLDSYPVMRTLRPSQDPTFEGTMAAAWKHRVLQLLAAQEIDEEDVISVDALEPLHAVGCVLQLAEGSATASPDLIERMQRRWEKLASDLFARKDWYVAEQVESPSPRPQDTNNVARSRRMVR